MLQRLKPEAICWSSVRFGQQVAGQLLDRELVERHVAVEGVDDPVAIGPDLAVVVEVDAVRVGIAGGVEPVAAAVLAPVRRRRAAGRPASRRRRATVSLTNASTSAGLGRQAGQVEAQRGGRASGGRPRGRAAGRVASSSARMNRSIGLRTQASSLTFGGAGRFGRDERPVRLILGALGDPPLEDVLLLGRERLLGRRRRHHLVGVGRVDPLDQLALVELARDDRAELRWRPRAGRAAGRPCGRR